MERVRRIKEVVSALTACTSGGEPEPEPDPEPDPGTGLQVH